jgi:hypothetical protein
VGWAEAELTVTIAPLDGRRNVSSPGQLGILEGGGSADGRFEKVMDGGPSAERGRHPCHVYHWFPSDNNSTSRHHDVDGKEGERA